MPRRTTAAAPPHDGGAPETVFYDGECGLCHSTVRWLLRADASGERFRFAPLGGQRFGEVFDASACASLPDSLVVQTHDGRTLVQAAAIAHLLLRLGGGWGRLGLVVRATPTFIGDGLYKLVARARKRLFQRPATTCPRLPPELACRVDR